MSKAQTILVPVDFSACSRAAALRARAFAQRAGFGLRLFHAVPMPVPVLSREFPVPPELRESARRQATQRLDSLRAELTAGDLLPEVVLCEAPATLAIQRAAAADDVAMVVMGTQGWSRLGLLLLGSIARETLRGVSTPVMVVKESGDGAGGEIRRILVATDFSEHAKVALELAAVWARRFGAALELVHVMPEMQPFITAYALHEPDGLMASTRRKAQERLDAWVRCEELRGLMVTSQVLHGEAAREIATRAGEFGAHLVVTGTRGHSALERLVLGSVAERVMRLAPCSVLVTRRVDDA